MNTLEHSVAGNFEPVLPPLRYTKFDPATKRMVEAPNALELAKTDRAALVNEWRREYSFGFFEFQGKEISCDQLSRSDIDGINGYVALNNALPPGWAGQWKCRDNTFIAIPDAATWRELYEAMVNQGQAAFVRAQQLKAQIQACTSLEEVLSIEVYP
jgi:hypothetical protein